MKFIAVLLIGLLVIAGCEETKSDKNAKTGETMITNPVVVLETSMGNIEIQLRPDKAPKHCENFIKLVSDTFYNGLTFHRVIPGFVIQGGDPQGTGAGGPGYNVPAEITDLKHTIGAVAAARKGDQVNPKRESSGSQFYIALGNLTNLDGAYTVFGYVTAGMDVAQKIAAVQRDPGDKPLTPVVINKAYIKTK